MASPKLFSFPRPLQGALLLVPLVLLAGCDMVVMSPSGDVAMQQRDLILWATGLMLIVIVPVIIMTLMFAWRYRASNRDAEYSPDWDHSTTVSYTHLTLPTKRIV